MQIKIVNISNMKCMLLLYCQFLRHIHKIIRWLHSIFLPTQFFNNKLLLSMILQLLSKLLRAYFEFLYRNTFIFFFSLYSVGIHRNAHWVILVLTFQSKLNHLAVSPSAEVRDVLKIYFLRRFLMIESWPDNNVLWQRKL